MKDKWKIDTMVNNSLTNRNIKQQQDLVNITFKHMIAAMQHENLMQSQGHASKFVRSSKKLKEISHASYMAKSIETGLLTKRNGPGKTLMFDFNITSNTTQRMICTIKLSRGAKI